MNKVSIIFMLLYFFSCSEKQLPKYILTNKNVKLIYEVKTIHTLNYQKDIKPFLDTLESVPFDIHAEDIDFINDTSFTSIDSTSFYEFFDTLFITDTHAFSSDSIIFEYNTKLLPLHDWCFESKTLYYKGTYICYVDKRHYILLMDPNLKKSWINHLMFGRIEYCEISNTDTTIKINSQEFNCLVINSKIKSGHFENGERTIKCLNESYGLIYYKNNLGEEIKLIDIIKISGI